MRTAYATSEDGGNSDRPVLGQIEFNGSSPVGAVSELWPAKGVIFRQVEGDYDLDFHNAPRRQFVVNLTGSVDIEIGDGARRSTRCSG